MEGVVLKGEVEKENNRHGECLKECVRSSNYTEKRWELESLPKFKVWVIIPAMVQSEIQGNMEAGFRKP